MFYNSDIIIIILYIIKLDLIFVQRKVFVYIQGLWLDFKIAAINSM